MQANSSWPALAFRARFWRSTTYRYGHEKNGKKACGTGGADSRNLWDKPRALRLYQDPGINNKIPAASHETISAFNHSKLKLDHLSRWSNFSLVLVGRACCHCAYNFFLKDHARGGNIYHVPVSQVRFNLNGAGRTIFNVVGQSHGFAV